MTYFLYGLFFVSCIVLIITVLLQPGKSDAGALFTSSVSSNAYGSRGTATVLSKTTIIAATVFMLSALMLAMPALNGGVSVLSSNPDTTTDAPAIDSNANVSTNADPNSNSSITVPPLPNDSNVATPAPSNNAANTAVNTTKANTQKKPDSKQETNTKK